MVGGWGRGRPCSLFGWRDEDETGYVTVGDMFDIHLGGAYVSSSLAHHLPPSTTPTVPWSPSQALHLPQPPIASPAPALSSTPPSPSHNVDFALVWISPGARCPCRSSTGGRCQSSTGGDRVAKGAGGLVARPINSVRAGSKKQSRDVMSLKRRRRNGS